MDIPRFRFDYSFLDLAALAAQCITTDEVETVFYNVRTFYDHYNFQEEYEYMIGFSLKHKFIAFTFSLVDREIIRFVQVYLPYEREIKNRYFGG